MPDLPGEGKGWDGVSGAGRLMAVYSLPRDGAHKDCEYPGCGRRFLRLSPGQRVCDAHHTAWQWLKQRERNRKLRRKTNE